MTPTKLIAGYRSNPTLKTLQAPVGWKGTPIDKRGRFLNLEFPYTPSLAQVIRWKLQPNPDAAKKRIENWHPAVSRDNSWLDSEEDIMVWLGHASYFFRINGVQLLVDPVFGDIWTAKRKSEFPIDAFLFTNLDFILLSHDHRDHLDKDSLKLLAKQNPEACYLSGLCSEELIRDFTGSKIIVTAGWYQQFDTGQKPLSITFIPSRHWSRRGIFDTNKRLWGGFAITWKNKQLVFCGDSGYDSHFKELKRVFGNFDYAIIGIGAYKPHWFMSHMHQSPAAAVKSFAELHARYLIPMHYGTFDLSDEALSQPLTDLHIEVAANGMTDKLMVLQIGKPHPLKDNG